MFVLNVEDAVYSDGKWLVIDRSSKGNMPEGFFRLSEVRLKTRDFLNNKKLK